MTYPCFTGKTLDDVMHEAIEAIINYGERIRASKGETRELTGVLIEITDPRARLSRTETRGKPFSCLGEFCWYLAKTNALDFISYYIPEYDKSAEGSIIYGGYGPRFFCHRGIDQVENVITLLRRKTSSRQAVIQLFDATDIVGEHKDIPCTCTLQFMIRQGVLNMVTYMRSNDVYLGLPHDVFSFTLLQEIIARTLSVEPGSYKHFVGSLHLYDTNVDAACQYLDEGWQSTIPMPTMPIGDPWRAIDFLRHAESAIRTGDSPNIVSMDYLEPYWADLVRLLQVFRYKKEHNASGIRALRGELSSNVYYPFVDRILQSLSSKPKNIPDNS